MPALLWIVLVSPPDAGAGPVPAWQPLGGGPITTSTDDQLGGAVWHEGQLYTVIETYHQADAEAVAASAPFMPQQLPQEVTVWRYDTSVQAWVRVGGPLNLDLRDAVDAPSLASAGGRLYVAFNERIQGRWRAVVRRLEDVRGLADWEFVGAPTDTVIGRPALAAVGATVWLAWAEPAHRGASVRSARLLGNGRWTMRGRDIPVDDDAVEVRMVGTPTGAYLSILEHRWDRLRVLALTETDTRVLGVSPDDVGTIEDVAMTVLTMPSGQPRLFVAYATPGRVLTYRTSAFGDFLLPVVAVPAPALARFVGIDIAIVAGAPHLAMLTLQPQPARPEPGPAASVARLAWDELPARIEPLATQPLGDLRLGDPHLLQNQTGRPLLGIGLDRGGRQHAAMLVYNAEPDSH